ncbi:MAG: hypothetical protein Ta2E_01700 [Mycoplasmoidaceae bacterium]|nr:MAG: hypothetical protein Ta2E_01700 [Mycoplasmoidaceae bacterium]
MNKKNEFDKIKEAKSDFVFNFSYRLFAIIFILFLDIFISTVILLYAIYIKLDWFYSLPIIFVISAPPIYVMVRISIGIHKWFITHNKIKKLLSKYEFTKKIRDSNFCNSKEKELKKKLLKLYDTETDTPFDRWTTLFSGY